MKITTLLIFAFAITSIASLYGADSVYGSIEYQVIPRTVLSISQIKHTEVATRAYYKVEARGVLIALAPLGKLTHELIDTATPKTNDTSQDYSGNFHYAIIVSDKNGNQETVLYLDALRPRGILNGQVVDVDSGKYKLLTDSLEKIGDSIYGKIEQ